MTKRWVIALATSIALIAGATWLWETKPWWPDIVIASPGPTGRRINESRVFANFYPAKVDRPGPAVMLLGGSEGGIGSVPAATALQAHGFSVLTPAYFGGSGQPGHLEHIPLETFDRALAWLRRQPQVDGARVGVIGESKGAEAALLLGVRDTALRAVVALSPSSYVWPGVNPSSLKAGSSWTVRGKPLPVLPYGRFHLGVLLGHLGVLYREGLQARAKHPAAGIAIDRASAPVLLVCGRDDTLWPSCAMSEQLRDRAAAAGKRIDVLSYANAGHEVFGPPEDRGDTAPHRWGGTSQSNNAARADAWPKVIEFLRRSLA